MDILNLINRDDHVIFAVIGTGGAEWNKEYPESADGKRMYPPTKEQCLGLIAEDGRFFAVRLVYGDNKEALAQQAYTDPDLKLAREFEEREQPGPDDYEPLFGAPPVIKPPAPSRGRN